MVKRLKNMIRLCGEYRFFFGLFLLMNLIFAFFLWLTDAPSFFAVAGSFLCVTLFLLVGALYVIAGKEEKRRAAFLDFLDNPDMSEQLNTVQLLGDREQEWICAAGEQLRENDQRLKEEIQQREDYEEYIEMWAHEVKVPLSLLTLMLDNRREEMSPAVHQRLVYVGSRIQDNVTQMLYYARLKAVHKDYVWEKVGLDLCVEEVISQYEPVFREGGMKVICEVSDAVVLTDRKGMAMILGQVFNNAYQYRDMDKEEQWVRVSDHREKDNIFLTVADNGIGVKPADLPFLLEKGFTGDNDERKKKATGMGLYLVEQMARNLKLEVDVQSVYEQGFELVLKFPVVD